MPRILYIAYIRRLFLRRLGPAIFVFLCFHLVFTYQRKPSKEPTQLPTITPQCDFKPATDEFIRNYKPNAFLGTQPDRTRVEPTIERIRILLEIIRSKEAQYQSLLETLDVFDMLQPMASLKAYTDESNIDEIKTLYDRYIKITSDGKTIEIDPSFLDYLKLTSSYLSDGLRDKRTRKFEVPCLRKPVFVLACNSPFFDIAQGTIHSLDIHWPNHQIVFYDMGLTESQNTLLKEKCKQCTVIEFPFPSIEKYAPHIRTLGNYAFKPFVVQDALRRYGTIIYGDASARFNKNSFDPVLVDNYIRGFAARELPGHFLPCYTRSGAIGWFNQSHTQFDDIYMAEANFLAVTDTFLSRLIMKAWLICALDPACLIAHDSVALCSRASAHSHRFDQSAMVIILTHFFFQGNRSTWSDGKVNDPAPYDMFTSVQMNLGDIRRGMNEGGYLEGKKIV